MDSNTTSGANASIGSRIRYLRHPALLLTRAADEEWNFWSSSSRHPGAAVARKTRAIGRELLRTVMALPMDAGVPQCPLLRSTCVGGMSPIGPKRTCLVAPHMSAFGGKADSTVRGNSLSRSLSGVKRTCPLALHMSAFDPKRTWAPTAQRPETRVA